MSGLIRMELPVGRDLAELAAAAAVELFTQPENWAGLAGGMLLPLVVFRRRPPLLPWLVVALAGDQIFRRAYRASCDLAELAAAARAAGPGGNDAAGADTPR